MDHNLTEYFKRCSGDERGRIFDRIIEQIEILNDRMIDKTEVAEKAGMSVSWLDNSDCEKAVKLRGLGVRYGKSQTSPIRFPLSKVIKLCRIDERFTRP